MGADMFCGSLSLIFNLAAGTAGGIAWTMSLLAINFEVEMKSGSKMPSIWTQMTDPEPGIFELERFSAPEVAGLVFLFFTVLFGLFPAIGSVVAALSSYCEGGGATGCLVCGYFTMAACAAFYWLYRIDTPTDVAFGPCAPGGNPSCAAEESTTFSVTLEHTHLSKFFNPFPDTYMAAAIAFYFCGMLGTMLATACANDDDSYPHEGSALKGGGRYPEASEAGAMVKP